MKPRFVLSLFVGTAALTACSFAQPASGLDPRGSATSAVGLPYMGLPREVASVFENYFKIHTALAQDSLEGVTDNAETLAKAVRRDPGKALPLRVARQADRLARAKNLTEARDAFLRISASLIAYVKENRLAGFYLGYCRMQRVAWLQTDPTIANPYMGKAMPRCAWFRELNVHNPS